MKGLLLFTNSEVGCKMKCQYCDADIKDGSLFCENCGQAVEGANASKSGIDVFWQKENSKKQKDVITQLSGLKQKSEQIQNAIAFGRRYKSKNIFKMLFLLLLPYIAVLAYSIYKANDNLTEPYISLSVASILTLTFVLLIAAYATMVVKKGGVGVFYPLIPTFGFYYLLYSIFCGIKQLFVPLEKDEAVYAKGLKVKVLELGLLKKEEKDLKTGLSLVDKNILKDPTLLELKKTIVTEKRKINGWQVSSVIFFILIVVAFGVSYYFAPMLIESLG